MTIIINRIYGEDFKGLVIRRLIRGFIRFIFIFITFLFFIVSYIIISGSIINLGRRLFRNVRIINKINL
jgi:hypothetical protein